TPLPRGETSGTDSWGVLRRRAKGATILRIPHARETHAMPDETPPHGRITQPEPAVAEIDILWITAGLGCDGDTIAITAAPRPSLEALLPGALPGLPRVRLHNPVLAYANGDDFLEPFRRAAAGNLAPFLLVIEGSIPNERNKAGGYWAALG